MTATAQSSERRVYGRRLGFAAGAACIIFAVVTVLRVGYVPSLAAWFVCCLLFFHAYFAFQIDLTTRDVKSLDYWYLGAAAAGLFLLAAGAAEQRIQVLGMAELDYRKGRDKFERSALTTELNEILAKYCQNERGERYKPYCEAFFDSWHLIQNDYTHDQLKELIANLKVRKRSLDEMLPKRTRREVIKDLIERKDSDLISPEMQLRMEDEYVREYLMGRIIRSLGGLVETGEAAKRAAIEPNRKEIQFVDVVFGFAQTLLWPFILAIAFALRITKVTIEVLGWSSNFPTLLDVTEADKPLPTLTETPPRLPAF